MSETNNKSKRNNVWEVSDNNCNIIIFWDGFFLQINNNNNSSNNGWRWQKQQTEMLMTWVFYLLVFLTCLRAQMRLCRARVCFVLSCRFFYIFWFVPPYCRQAASKLKILFVTFLILLLFTFGELLLATMRSMHRFRDFIFWILWFAILFSSFFIFFHSPVTEFIRVACSFSHLNRSLALFVKRDWNHHFLSGARKLL